MSETNYTQSRPANWSMEQEGYHEVTRLDYHGVPYTVWESKSRKLNYAELWAAFMAPVVPKVDIGASWEKMKSILDSAEQGDDDNHVNPNDDTDNMLADSVNDQY